MNNHLGFAFSVEHITYAHFLQTGQGLILNRLGMIKYPFSYEESTYFTLQNVRSLSGVIQQEIISLGIQDPHISISIEANLPKMKRVLIPKKLDKETVTNHVEWDLQQGMFESLDYYMYLMTENSIVFGPLQDILVIAIKKKVLEFYKKIIRACGYKLDNLGIHHLAAELCFRNGYQEENSGLKVIFKISTNRIETIYLWEGNYYLSKYEKIELKQPNRKFEDIMIDRVSSAIKSGENLFEEIEKKSIAVEKIYIYGDGASQELITLITKNVSKPVEKFDPFRNLKLMDGIKWNGQASQFVECIGIPLDLQVGEEV
jgi:Tfp pilus assembly PilM family ATPase